MVKHMARNVRRILISVRDMEHVMYPDLIMLKLIGPTWKWEITGARIIPGFVQHTSTNLLLRVKRRVMIERKRLGKMLAKNQVRRGIQVVFRNPDRSPQ